MDYKNCNLCPRHCGVDRTARNLGFCGMTAQMTAARAGLHYGEEPVISGSFGSGTIFFSGCSLGCKFCQNEEISLGKSGKIVDAITLRATMEDLIDQGAENINLVTPTHFLPSILPALTPKLPVPVVYNCGGYESLETLKVLDGLVDIYMPDFKFFDPNLGKVLASAPNYPQIAKTAILEMYRQTGAVQFNEEGIMTKGVLIRHLVLPGNVGNSLDVIDWIAETFPQGQVLFSLMAQYVPHGPAKEIPPFNRTITEDEWAAVTSWLELSGLKNGFIQEPTAATNDLLPKFDGTGFTETFV